MKDGNRAVEFHRLSYSGGTEEGELVREVLSPVSVLELQGALLTNYSVKLSSQLVQKLNLFHNAAILLPQ